MGHLWSFGFCSHGLKPPTRKSTESGLVFLIHGTTVDFQLCPQQTVTFTDFLGICLKHPDPLGGQAIRTEASNSKNVFKVREA